MRDTAGRTGQAGCAGEIVSRTLTIVSLACIIIVTLSLIFAKPLVRVLGTGVRRGEVCARCGSLRDYDGVGVFYRGCIGFLQCVKCAS